MSSSVVSGILQKDITATEIRESLNQSRKLDVESSKRALVLYSLLIVGIAYLLIGLADFIAIGNGQAVPYHAFFLAPWKVAINFAAQLHHGINFFTAIKGN